MKPAVFNLTEEDRAWIKKSAKEFKADGESAFMRTVLAWLRETDIKELKGRMMKAAIEAELEDARQKAAAAQKRQEELESKLEALIA